MYAARDTKYQQHMELTLHHSLVHDIGPAMPPETLLRAINPEPLLPPRATSTSKSDVMLSRRRISRHRLAALVAARGRILHCLGGGCRGSGGGSLSSWGSMVMQENMDKEHRQRDKCSATRQAMFTDYDDPLPQILVEVELAMSWALDRSKTTVETSKSLPPR